jgi:hypothetical protein
MEENVIKFTRLIRHGGRKEREVCKVYAVIKICGYHIVSADICG